MAKWFLILCLSLAAVVSAETKVLAFAGSTREGSINKKLIQNAAEIAKQFHANVTVIDLKDFAMPFYDGDLETNEGMPAKAKQLRQLMIDSNVIIIASPEYNGSLPGVLKNALDWASRSEEGNGSRDAYKGKKFILLATSPGNSGGSRGLVHLKSIIENVGGTVAPDVFTLPNGYQAFDAQGHLNDPTKVKELTGVIQSGLQ